MSPELFVCLSIYENAETLSRLSVLVRYWAGQGECVCVALYLLNRYWGIVTVPVSFLKAGDLG